MESDISIAVLSLQIALVATVVTVPVAMLVAWLLSRKNFRGRFVLDVFVSLPLALPPVVIGYVLLWIVGTNSWLGQLEKLLFGYYSDNGVFGNNSKSFCCRCHTR